MNISIDSSLHEKLQAFKEQLNFSQVCQEALEVAIRPLEAKSQSLSAREVKLEQFRAQKAQLESEEFADGKVDGAYLFESLDFTDLKAIALAAELNGHYRTVDMFPEHLQEKIEDELKKGEILCPEMYLMGLWEGVLEAWEEIVDEI